MYSYILLRGGVMTKFLPILRRQPVNLHQGFFMYLVNMKIAVGEKNCCCIAKIIFVLCSSDSWFQSFCLS